MIFALDLSFWSLVGCKQIGFRQSVVCCISDLIPDFKELRHMCNWTRFCVHGVTLAFFFCQDIPTWVDQ